MGLDHQPTDFTSILYQLHNKTIRPKFQVSRSENSSLLGSSPKCLRVRGKVWFCVCVSVHVLACVRVCVCMSTCLSVCVCACMLACMRVHLSVCVSVCVRACVRACPPVCLCSTVLTSAAGMPTQTRSTAGVFFPGYTCGGGRTGR